MTVAWFIHATRLTASARLQGFLIHEALRGMGVRSRILLAPPVWTTRLPWRDDMLEQVADSVEADVAVFQKISDPRLGAVIRRLRERGVRTVYVQCDFHPDSRLPFLCDHVVVPSTELFRFYAERSAACTLIPDPIELQVSRDAIGWRRISHGASEKPLTLVWVGHRTNWEDLQQVQPVLAAAGGRRYRLVTVSDHPGATFRWRPGSVKRHVLGGDVGIVPTLGGPRKEMKSHNRVTLFMALGLPVVGGDIPAYREVIEHGRTGYLAATAEDWRRALEALADPSHRRQVALLAYDEIVPRFSLTAVAQQWKSMLDAVCKPGGAAAATGSLGRRGSDGWAPVALAAWLHYTLFAFKSRQRGPALRSALHAVTVAALRPRLWGYLARRLSWQLRRDRVRDS